MYDDLDDDCNIPINGVRDVRVVKVFLLMYCINSQYLVSFGTREMNFAVTLNTLLYNIFIMVLNLKEGLNRSKLVSVKIEIIKGCITAFVLAITFCGMEMLYQNNIQAQVTMYK